MILLLLANGFHENELTEQIPALRAGGCDFRTASLADETVTSASGRIFDCEYTLENLPAEEIDLLILSDTAQNLPAALLIAQGVRMNGGRVSFFHTKYKFAIEPEATAETAADIAPAEKPDEEDLTPEVEPAEETAESEEEPVDEEPIPEEEPVEETAEFDEEPADEEPIPEELAEETAEFEKPAEEPAKEDAMQDEAPIRQSEQEDAAEEPDGDAPAEDRSEEAPYRHISPSSFPSRPLPDRHFLSCNSRFRAASPVYEEQVGESLVGFLENFGIIASPVSIHHSARYTVYTVSPRDQTPTDLLSEVILRTAGILAEEGIRLIRSANNPFTLDFEVENREALPLTLGDMMEKKAIPVPSSYLPFGETPSGEAIFLSPDALGNLLIAGQNEEEKLSFLHSFLSSFLVAQRPNDAVFLTASPTDGFACYNSLPHCLMPSVKTADELAGVLLWLNEESELRTALYRENGCSSHTEYITALKNDPALGCPIPQIFVVLHEIEKMQEGVISPLDLLADLIPAFETVGIHVILSLSDCKHPVFSSHLLEAFRTRLCFAVASAEDSVTILGEEGAEQLTVANEAFLLSANRFYRIECPSIDASDREKLMTAIFALYPTERQNPLLPESIDTLFDSYLRPASDEVEEESISTAEEEAEETKEPKEPEEKPDEAPTCEEAEEKQEPEQAEEPEEDAPEAFDEQEEKPEEAPADGQTVPMKSLLQNQSFLAAARASLKLGKISANRLMLLFDFDAETAEEILGILEVLGLVSEADGKGERITKMNETEWTSLLKEIAQS